MLDHRVNIIVRWKTSELLVFVSPVTSRHRDGRRIPFHHLWRDLCIVSSCRRHVNVKHGVGRRIDQQRCLQLLDGEVRSLRVMS
jgi:hypothetical protein